MIIWPWWTSYFIRRREEVQGVHAWWIAAVGLLVGVPFGGVLVLAVEQWSWRRNWRRIERQRERIR